MIAQRVGIFMIAMGAAGLLSWALVRLLESRQTGQPFLPDFLGYGDTDPGDAAFFDPSGCNCQNCLWRRQRERER